MKKVKLELRKASIQEPYETQEISLKSLIFLELEKQVRDIFREYNEYAQGLEEIDEYGDVACFVNIFPLEKISESELEALVSELSRNNLQYFSFEKTPEPSFENIDIWDGIDF